MRRFALAILPAALFAPLALAHTGQGDGHDFLAGLLHPFTGVDHALAMIGVGALAASLGARARWRLPAAFLATLSAGLASGHAGFALAHAETGVAASVGAMGLMLLAGRQLPAPFALGLVCAFGILHGTAHGAEMQDAGFAAHGTGFLLSTALLHGAGFAIGTAVAWLAAARQSSYRRGSQLPPPEAH